MCGLSKCSQEMVFLTLHQTHVWVGRLVYNRGTADCPNVYLVSTLCMSSIAPFSYATPAPMPSHSPATSALPVEHFPDHITCSGMSSNCIHECDMVHLHVGMVSPMFSPTTTALALHHFKSCSHFSTNLMIIRVLKFCSS